MKWHCEMFRSSFALVSFLNENDIKPENCKITESEEWFTLFYYK